MLEIPHLMQAYVELPFGQHMGFLIDALDGKPPKVASPGLPSLPTSVDSDLAKAAVRFLRRTHMPIDPRKQWPAGGLPGYTIAGNIKPDLQANPGKVLCVWGDAGWSEMVRRGKYHDEHFSDELVTACAEMVESWSPQPTPAWVTSVPSLRRPDLVPDFAHRLADRLGLPFQPIITRTQGRPEQKTMANSAQQARNVDGSLALNTVDMPIGPVLLVDDMVDSRWTLTVTSWLLRNNGSGDVFPVALALTGPRE